MELFSWPQHSGREFRLVGRIGKMLSFQSKASVLDIFHAGSSRERSVEEVAGVELNSRLSSRDGKGAAALRIDDPRGKAELSGSSIKDEIVVVATGKLQLLEVVIDSRANRGGFAKIKRRSCDSR